MRRLSCVQLDSITAVERSHRIVLGSRVGAYPRGTVAELLARGRVFEQWAHEACLVPIEDYRLLKRRMRGRRVHRWYGDVLGANPALRAEILRAIEERGPLGSRAFEGKKGPGMWSPKPAKQMLEALWSAGELVVATRRGFERLYDLPERVIPREHLDAPVPSEDEYLRALVLRAVCARGVLSERAAADHYRISGGTRRVRPHVRALVERGKLVRVELSDGGPPLLVPAGTPLDPPVPSAAVLLSPFDNLLWDRPLAARLFGFEHLIEVYKRPHERRWGYYVLPFLRGDRIAGRADVRADRGAGVLRVLALHLERGVRESAALRTAFEGALARLAAVVEVGTIETPWSSRRARFTRGRSRTRRPAP